MAIAYSDYTSRLERLVEVCKNLSSNLELEPLLHSIIETASELTYSESSSILVFDEENNYLKFIAAPWFLMETLKTIGVPLDKSVAGWVYTHIQPMALHHADKDDRIFRVVDRQLTDSTSSILAVPMVFKGEAIGVMECVNKSNNGHYTEEDVTILETLAAQAAVVIQNHLLLDSTQQAYEKVMELDRMKSDFMAITSHELRTPLGLVLGHSSLLMDSASEDQKQDLQVIANSANRLKEIIEEFSDVDNLENGLNELRRKKVSMSMLVRDVVDSFKDMAEGRKVSLISDVPGHNMVVEGDGDKIGIALRNLIKNALTFTNPGGKVKVKAEQVPGYVKVSVMDNGIGIPPDELEKIFERFYQVEKHLTRKHGGIGLGLSIAREMIEKHGGKIGLESVEGMGSKFMFFLPSNAAQANAAQRVFHTGSLGNDGTGPLGKNPSSKPNTGNLIKSNTGNLVKNGKGGV
jgi:signal transduction histidine kinase